MMIGYAIDNERLRVIDDPLAHLEQIVWIDLISPGEEEEHRLEQALGIDIPTREEMGEIESSSRLYQESGAIFMIAVLLSQTESVRPVTLPVSFVLAGERLVTVRYEEPRAFRIFSQRAQKIALGLSNGESILIALLEAIIDRLADILERAGNEIDALSRDIFAHHGEKPTKGRDFQAVLKQIARQNDLSSNVQESLVSLQRLFGFLAQTTTQNKSDKDIRSRVKTLTRDAISLADYASFLSAKITFLLDATLGMINIEQNAIIKIFSVAAVVFLPPTLIASIYGMNFRHMPELEWTFGYPLALLMMIGSAILPYLYFKRRGWL
jgi:magnesium transporter